LDGSDSRVVTHRTVVTAWSVAVLHPAPLVDDNQAVLLAGNQDVLGVEEA
jgi:hypothetical protein